MIQTKIVHISEAHLGGRRHDTESCSDWVPAASGRAIEGDALVRDGRQQPRRTRVERTVIRDGGGTGRVGTGGALAGIGQLLVVDDGTITRHGLVLDTRHGDAVTITVGSGDEVVCDREILDGADRSDAAATIEVLEDRTGTADHVTQVADDGAAVDGVDDEHRHVDSPVDDRGERAPLTARNAVETAALQSFRQRSARETATVARNAIETAGLSSIRQRSERETATVAGNVTGTATVDGSDDERERDDEPTTDMTEEREELIGVRDQFDATLSELESAIDELDSKIDAIEDDLTATMLERDSATEAFLPDDQLPASVSNETRGAVASHVETLSERRDVRREQAAMKRETKGVETKNAGDARDDIEEIEVVIDRLRDRTEESERALDDAREELEDVRERFEDDLAVLESQLAPFDIDLTAETLEAVIDARIPERKSELQESVETARARIAELSTRQSRLATERDKLTSIEGGGTCPTCSQAVGPERTGDERDAIEAELQQVEEELEAATQERDESIARREELSELRDRAIVLASFRSGTVAEAAGDLEDREETTAGLEADLEEERVGLSTARAERDRADAVIATLEMEIAALEDEIDSLGADITDGRTILEAFLVGDALRAQLEALHGELADLQAEYDEKNVERAALQAEIEALSDDG